MLHASLLNVNRDPTTHPQPYTYDEFMPFRPRLELPEDDEDDEEWIRSGNW